MKKTPRNHAELAKATKPKTKRDALVKRAKRRRVTKAPAVLTLLTISLVDEIVKVLMLGNYQAVAFRFVGIKPKTGAAWMQQGKLLVELGEYDAEGGPPYRYLYESVMRSQEKAQVATIAVIQKAARTGYDPEFAEVDQVVKGEVVRLRKLVRLGTAPDWRAAAWLAERRWAEYWAGVDKVEAARDRSQAMAAETADVPVAEAAADLDPRSHVAKALGLDTEAAVYDFGIAVAKQLDADKDI